LTLQDLTMANQTVLLHCWTSYNQDHGYKRYSLHKLALLYLLTYVEAHGDLRSRSLNTCKNLAYALSFNKHLN